MQCSRSELLQMRNLTLIIAQNAGMCSGIVQGERPPRRLKERAERSPTPRHVQALQSQRVDGRPISRNANCARFLALRCGDRFCSPPCVGKEQDRTRSFAKDEFIRGDSSSGALGKLKALFRHDGKGSVTAGNSSRLNDEPQPCMSFRESAEGFRCDAPHAHTRYGRCGCSNRA